MKTETMELVPTPAQVPTRQQDVAPLAVVNINALLEKAIDAKSAVEVMERLQAMRRELRAEQAKEAFDSAMAAFQSECPIVYKLKAGAQNAYKYAPLPQIVAEVREHIKRHGFSYTITGEVENGWVKAVCKVTHSAGHSELSEFKAPIDADNKMMRPAQRYGAAMTFCKRYAFTNAFGILTAEEDLDSLTHKPKPQGPSSMQPEDAEKKALAKQLWDLLKEVRGTEKNWKAANAWLHQHDIISDGLEAPHLMKEQFNDAIVKSRITLGVA